MPGDVVRQHPQEHVRTDRVLGAVADRADVQVGIEGPERPLHLGERLVGGDHLAPSQLAAGDGGAQHVDAVGAVWHGCGRLPMTAIRYAGCCTALLYRSAGAGKSIVKGLLTPILRLQGTPKCRSPSFTWTAATPQPALICRIRARIAGDSPLYKPQLPGSGDGLVARGGAQLPVDRHGLGLDGVRRQEHRGRSPTVSAPTR